MTRPHWFQTTLLGGIRLVGSAEEGLQQLAFQVSDTGERSDDPVLLQAEDLLKRYLAGESVDFSVLPLAPKGTAFQQQVWKALQKISAGETRSYAWLAETVGNPKAIRAVGGANGKNPIPVIIPCHRVVQKDGSLGGYSAPGGVAIKQQLLQLEFPGITQALQEPVLI